MDTSSAKRDGILKTKIEDFAIDGIENYKDIPVDCVIRVDCNEHIEKADEFMVLTFVDKGTFNIRQIMSFTPEQTKALELYFSGKGKFKWNY